MKDLNKKSEFDGQWEEVFKDSEMLPSDRVWDKIDATLSREEVGFFQRKAHLYKMLAAASIAAVLAIGIFSANYYLSNESMTGQTRLDDRSLKDTELTISSNAPNVEKLDTEVRENEIDRATQFSANSNSVEAPEQIVDSQSAQFNANSKTKDQQLAVAVENANASHGNKVVFGTLTLDGLEEDKSLHENALIPHSSKVSSTERIAPDLNNMEQLQGILAVAFEDIPMEIEHIYKIPFMPKGASKVKNEKESGFFLAGLDISTGVFDPNFQQRGGVATSSLSLARVESSNDQLASFNTANKDFLSVRSAENSAKPEIAYSYGANIGFKLTDRVIVQTGFGYRKANSTTITNGFIEDINSGVRIPIVASYQYQLEGLSRVNKIQETDLENQYEFASIPVRAGYIVMDKKVNLTLMAGVSSEFFLSNQIVDRSDFFKTLDNSAGDTSPYKSVYFNGSLGTMLGYTIAKNYVLTLEPSYKFAINSFTKDDFYLNSLPSSFMVSFGVVYNFR